MQLQPSSSFLFIFIVLLNIGQPSLAIVKPNPELYDACRLPFRCGDITVGYPFWGGDRPHSCGYRYLQLKCEIGGSLTSITIEGVNYFIKKIDERTQTLKIVRQEYYFDGVCLTTYNPPSFLNTTIDYEFFDYSTGYENVAILYGCPFSAIHHPGHLACSNDSLSKDVFIQVEANASGACNSCITIPVSTNVTVAAKGNPSVLEKAILEGFEVKWKVDSRECEDCRKSNGSCGFEGNRLICYCPNQRNLYTSVCTTSSSAIQSPPPQLSISAPAVQSPPLSGPTTGVLVGIFIFLFVLLISGVGRKLIRDEDCSKKNENIKNMEAFVRHFGSLVPQRFEYADIKKMTKSFSKKLGQGGYGDVYQGKLADGRLVAVKLLKESKGNGEEFINEVASISKTSHVNIVTLLGFCHTRNKKALVYEFLSNGSLNKFIYDKESSSINHNLEWKTRYQIAIGIARGLEYLHRGCNIRIMHFDIKPHNILLDEDFCPKISDFGLAKLCKKKESIISMFGTRGTVGYIAPEVFCKTFGEVSHKSDVYNYGMMILEMVGGRKSIDGVVSHTSDIYFPNWIYKQLEPGKDFEFHGVVTEEEKEIAKKMIIVSMWCIQTNPSDRPSMSKVVEMLEGSRESLQIPSKPSLSLPARSPKHSIPLWSFSTSTSSHKPVSLEEVCIDLSDVKCN